VVPTAEGPQTIDSHYTYTANDLSTGPFRGEFTGDHFTGSFEFTVLDGDCVTRPVTKLQLQLQGVLRG
jgi:hypothetical protein